MDNVNDLNNIVNLKASKKRLISPEEASRLGFAIPEENRVYGDFTEPKKVGKAYKVFFLCSDGKIYPPMVANDKALDTPIGIWVPCGSSDIIGYTVNGHRPHVRGGGPGTKGKGTNLNLSFRPGWHMSEIPYAEQFLKRKGLNEKLIINGQFVWPKELIWAECLYSNDVDYQDESMSYGYSKNGKFRYSYAGLPRIPKGGSYKYRTNPDPNTVAWIIAGAIKVNRLLAFDEVDRILLQHGITPPIVMDEVEVLEVKRKMKQNKL
jgi:hypothetical protein